MTARCFLLVGGLALGACRYDLDRVGALEDDAMFVVVPDSLPRPGSDGGTTMVVSFDEGLMADTFLHESTGSPNGAVNYLYLDGSPQDRILMQFDVSGVPSGARVREARLVVEVVEVNDFEWVTLHPVLSAWSESDATWTMRTASEPWSTPGGDVGPAIGPAFMMGALGGLDLDVTSLVQGWVDGAENDGVMFILEGFSEAHLTARESTFPGSALWVAYE